MHTCVRLPTASGQRLRIPAYAALLSRRDARLDDRFLQEAEAAGLQQLKGHRSVGGMRASLYNAMPRAGVEALVAFMRDFERRNG